MPSPDTTDHPILPSHPNPPHRPALPHTPKPTSVDALVNKSSTSMSYDPARAFDSPPPQNTTAIPGQRGPPPPPIMRYSHLPTPQSPNINTNLNNNVQYPTTVPQTPQSPVQPLQLSTISPVAATPTNTSRPTLFRAPSSHQIMTPDSSPFAVRRAQQPQLDGSPIPVTPTPAQTAKSPALQTPPASSPMVIDLSPFNVDAARHIVSPPPASSHPLEQQPSNLSSPFMATPFTSDRPKSPPSSPTRGAELDLNFFAPKPSDGASKSSVPFLMPGRTDTVIISTPPISPPPVAVPQPISTLTIGKVMTGPEIDRLRQAMLQERLTQIKDVEARRPEYLKRTKRSFDEAEPPAFMADDNKFGSVGITDSPNKGRRIKLFQETSEESFEESLMAGGYGRYRTAEWGRPAQPAIFPNPPQGAAEVSPVAEEPEASPAPMTEKEFKKQKRLAAFRSDLNNTEPTNKLFAVELEGRGRVLLDMPNEGLLADSLKKPGQNTSRRKKRADQPSAKERRSIAAAALAEENADRPNWPDAEFPWRVRAEERTERARADEVEKLKWIEKFLDRDTDDEEEDGETGQAMAPGFRDEEEEAISSSQWGVIYDDHADPPAPVRWGRGKVIPLRANPVEEPSRKKTRTFLPSDPADARAALLSKRSVRQLSYRQQRRFRGSSKAARNSDEDVLCICRGTDDGRELVQCDTCKMWFHLKCIGIKSIAELGSEDDPWYCFDCQPGGEASSSDSEPEGLFQAEPTFVPTDEFHHARNIDGTLFQASVQDSPGWSGRMPKTPKTPRRGRDDYAGPSTPRHQVHTSVRIQSSTPAYDGRGMRLEEFDPTSTPSRGLRFNGPGPFATPGRQVSGGWSSKANALLQTPSKASKSNKSSGSGPNSSLLSAYLEANPLSPGQWAGLGVPSTPIRFDVSPIRRRQTEDDGPGSIPMQMPRRILGAHLSAPAVVGSIGAAAAAPSPMEDVQPSTAPRKDHPVAQAQLVSSATANVHSYVSESMAMDVDRPITTNAEVSSVNS